MIRSLHLRYVGRMLRRNPTTSALAVAALGRGIGLTMTMFSFVHGVLLSQIPFDDPDPSPSSPWSCVRAWDAC